MKQEDREFLLQLQHEMLTQDKVCQANPRFWVVMQDVKDYWVDENTDGIFIYSPGECETVFEGDFEELAEWIKKLKGIKKCKYDYGFVEFTYKGDGYTISDINDLKSFLDDFDTNDYNIGYYRSREEIAKDTMFLTLRECKEHIKYNAHHYNKTAHPYAMTAWRSPQVARLYEILEKTDWEKE